MKILISLLACALFLGAGSAHAGIGLFDEETSTFFLKSAPTAGHADHIVGFGPPEAGWRPLTGDWNGDGVETVGLYAPESGEFFLRDELAPGTADVFFQFGPEDVDGLPVVGDWNGDGMDTVGLYHYPTDAFYLRDSNTPGPADHVVDFGPQDFSRWVPLVGDWAGLGRDGVGLYDPESGMAFLRETPTPGIAEIITTFEPFLPDAMPIAGDVNGDTLDTVSRFRPGLSEFLIHNDTASGGPQAVVQFGPTDAGWLPLVWNSGAQVTMLRAPDGPGNFLWKPGSDNTGKLVVLLPSSFNDIAVAVELHRAIPPNQQTLIEAGRFSGIANQNRGHWRFRQSGGAYGENIFVIAFTKSGELFGWFIEDGSERVD